jgi:ankyrin repeat protein
MSSLHLAVGFGDARLVEALLDEGAAVDVFDQTVGTPLCTAVANGFYTVAEALISKGADINCKTIDDEPLIYFAIMQFYREKDREPLPRHYPKDTSALSTLQLLLKSGCRLDIPSPNGIYPLYLATAFGNLPVVKLVLESGANPTIGMTDGSTPLHIALAGKVGREILDELVKAGADVTALNQTGSAPLYYATEQGLEDLLRIFLQKGPDLSITDPEGNTLFHAAVSSGNDKVLSIILQQFEAFPQKYPGAILPDINAVNTIGESPLHLAAAKNMVSAAQSLIDLGANLNARDGAHMTPLTEAMSAGHKEMMRFLVSHGADTSAAHEFRMIQMRTEDGTYTTAMAHVGEDTPDINSLRRILQNDSLDYVVDDSGVRLIESLLIRLSFDAL